VTLFDVSFLSFLPFRIGETFAHFVNMAEVRPEEEEWRAAAGERKC